jgi:hypothetical protein
MRDGGVIYPGRPERQPTEDEDRVGSRIEAKCSCGYEERGLLVGGGMGSYTAFCGFPVLCRLCGRVRTANLLAGAPPMETKERPGMPDPPPGPPKCGICDSPDIVPYDSPQLQPRPGEGRVTDWNEDRIGRVVRLNDGLYLCPKCGDTSLRFRLVGFFD